MSRTLAQLLEGSSHRLLGPASAEVRVDAVTADSRSVHRGSVFVAVRGHAADGHRFVDAAIAAHAAALVLESAEGLDLPKTLPVVIVDDARRALGHLVRGLHGHPDRDLRVVAVTGTNGKTTVSHLVRDLVREGGDFCGLLGTIRYETPRRAVDAPLTTPGPEQLLALLEEMRDGGASAVSMEASSHALDQRRLAGIEVDVAAFTNLTHEHLDYHGDLESYLDAKRLLLDHLEGPGRSKPRGVAVVNLDAPELAARPWPEGFVSVGSDDACTVRLLDASCTREGTTIHARIAGEDVELRSRLLGRYNVENLLVTAGIGHALGLSAADLARRFPALRPVTGRLEPVSLDGGPLTLIDYAHTPDGISSLLDAVRELDRGPVTFVFGCGGDRDRTKRPLMAAAALAGADRVILTLDNPRTEDPQRIFADTEQGFVADPARAERVEDRAQALARALECTPPDGIVVVAGKGHETYQIVGEEKLPWDDRSALRAAWSAKGRR